MQKITKIRGFVTLPIIIGGAIIVAGLIGGAVYELNKNNFAVSKNKMLAQVSCNTYWYFCDYNINPECSQPQSCQQKQFCGDYMSNGLRTFDTQTDCQAALPLPVPAPLITCILFTYSDWGACQSNNSQSRNVTSSGPSSCVGGNPITSQSCNYVVPTVTCVSFTYSDMSACQSNSMQYRSVITSSPPGCTGGNPITSQSCIYQGNLIPETAASISAFESSKSEIGSGETIGLAFSGSGISKYKLYFSCPKFSTGINAGLSAASAKIDGVEYCHKEFAIPTGAYTQNLVISSKYSKSLKITIRLRAYDSQEQYIDYKDVIITVANQTSSTINTTAVSATTPTSTTSTATSTQTSAPTATGIITKTFFQGMSDPEITTLQQILKTMPDVYPEGIVSGYFGNLTLQAVQRFQIKYNIVSSGTPDITGYGLFGPKTMAKINELTQAAQPGSSGFGSSQIIPSVSSTSTLTQSGSGLSSAQILTILELLRSFQVDAAIIANVQTSLTGVASAVSANKKTASSAQDSISTPNLNLSYTWNNDLYYGMRNNDDVKALQRALTEEGVYSEEITGNFFSITRQAVIDFQKKHNFTNIPGTGYVGSYTRKALNSLYSK